jgi:hypothetical protein
MTPEDFLSGLHGNPDILFQDVDTVNRRGLLVKLDEAGYRQASFLDNRAFRKETLGVWMPLPRILDQLERTQPGMSVHAIFHVSHCGSTLVSRLVAELPGCLPVREPLLLLALAQIRREDPALARLDEATWNRLFGAMLLHYSRGYRADERTVLKATSACGNLLAPLLQRSPDSKALLMHTDLKTWLTVMLRNEDVRHNGRFYAPSWLSDLRTLTGRADLRLSALADAEMFAVNWLGAMLHFERAVAAHGARVQRLDFEDLLADPAGGLAGVGGFFGFDAARAAEITSGPLMTRYAKNPDTRYDKAARQRQLQETRAKSGDEIAAGMKFAEKLCKETRDLAPLSAYFTRS